MAFLDKTKRNFARGKQLALEKMDRTTHTTDAEFKEWKNHYETLYKQIEKARLLFEDSYQSLKEFSVAQSEVSINFQRMFDSTTLMYGSVNRTLDCTRLVDAERMRFEEEMNTNVIGPIAKHLGQFKEIKDRIEVRDRRRLDMDRYARDVQVHTSNNHSEKAQKAQEKLDAMTNAYFALHAELVDDMKDIFHDRSLFMTPILATYITCLAQYFRGSSFQLQQMTPLYQNIDRSAIHEHIWVISQVSSTSPNERPAVPPKNGSPNATAANTTQAYQQYAHHDPTVIPPYNPHASAPPQGYPPQQGYPSQNQPPLPNRGNPPAFPAKPPQYGNQLPPQQYNQPPQHSHQLPPQQYNQHPGPQPGMSHQQGPPPTRQFPPQQGQSMPPPPSRQFPPQQGQHMPPSHSHQHPGPQPGMPHQQGPPPTRQFPPQQGQPMPPSHPDGRPRGPSFGNASQAPGQPPHPQQYNQPQHGHQLPPPQQYNQHPGPQPGVPHQQGQPMPPPTRQFPPQQGQSMPPPPARQFPPQQGQPMPPSHPNPTRQFPPQQNQPMPPSHPDGRPRGPSFGNASQAPGQIPQQNSQNGPQMGRPRGPSFGNGTAPGQVPQNQSMPPPSDGRPRGPSFGNGTAPGAGRPPMMAHGQLPTPNPNPQQRTQNPFEDNSKNAFQNDLNQALTRPRGSSTGVPPQQSLNR